jgi:HD superfamily phosphohydrolase
MFVMIQSLLRLIAYSIFFVHSVEMIHDKMLSRCLRKFGGKHKL